MGYPPTKKAKTQPVDIRGNTDAEGLHIVHCRTLRH